MIRKTRIVVEDVAILYGAFTIARFLITMIPENKPKTEEN